MLAGGKPEELLAAMNKEGADITSMSAPFITQQTFLGASLLRAYGFCPLNDSQDTSGCQLTNAPFGFGFHAQTCSV